jgi:hypothetical protein
MEQPLIKSNPLKWLEQNYERHNISTLAKMLVVSISGVEKMLLMIGVDVELKAEQKAFIKEFYSERTVDELVNELNVPGRPDNLLKKKVIHFINSSGLKKDAFPPPPKKPIRRPAADHTNVNHRDRVHKWASMTDAEIKSHKGRIIY